MTTHLVLILAEVDSDDLDAVHVEADQLARHTRHRVTVDGAARVHGVSALCLPSVGAEQLGAVLRRAIETLKGGAT